MGNNVDQRPGRDVQSELPASDVDSVKLGEQVFGDNPLEVRDTDHYAQEYVGGLVDKWDELIDWKARSEGAGEFFIDQLKARGVKSVLDVATGTGFHSVRLLEEGFDTVSADGSPQMLAQAFKNGIQYGGHVLRVVNADWRWLNRDVHGEYDAIICLGNSFTHLFSERDRRKALAEFYAMLKHDGVLIIDQRNYDAVLDGGAGASRTYYYCGNDVSAKPDHVDEGLARYKYTFPDKSEFFLNMYPLRKNYLRGLLRDVGFQQIDTFGDFQESYAAEEPDYFVHVVEKRYRPDDIAPRAGRPWNGWPLPCGSVRTPRCSTSVPAMALAISQSIDFDDLSGQLPAHYARILDETQRRESELADRISEQYRTKMKAGLQAWVEAGNDGDLVWGIFHARK